MRKLLIAVIFIFFVGGGYAAYQFWYKPSQLTPWSFVSKDALLVYQPGNFYSFWKDRKDLKIWKNLRNLDGVSRVDTVWAVIDSLAADSTVTQRFFDQNELLITYHKTAKDELMAAYVLKVNKLSEHDLLSKILGHFESSGFAKSQRQYQGFTIHEYQKGDIQFAYIFYSNFIVASFNPFLVEDGIRAAQDFDFEMLSSRAMDFSRVDNPDGKIYIQSDMLDKLIGSVANPVMKNLKDFKWLTDETYFDWSIEDDKINFSGFSTIDTADVNFLSSFAGVRGIAFDMKNVVPQRSALVFHVSFDDLKNWHRGLKNYWRTHDPSQLTRIGEIENKYDFDVNEFYEFIDDEIGYFLFESLNVRNPEKVFCIELKSQSKAEEFFDVLSVAAQQDTSKFEEQYAGRIIRQIDIDELPARIFGNMFSGFSSCFYTIQGNYALLGNNEYALKILIDDIDEENTWRQSVKTNTFLENTNDDANLGIYIKTAGIWNLFESKLNDRWRAYVSDNQETLKQIEYAAVQFTNVDDQFYTNITLSHPGRLLEKKKASSFEVNREVYFDAPLISKPFAVRNHNDQSLEMMMQDSLFDLHLITKVNDNALTIELDEPLVSKIFQLDYYKNNKLQYLFAVGSSVHLIDRTGTYIPGYPVKLKEEISKLSLIDYDNSKNYRIMVGTENGNYYLLNKAGGKLDKWKPRKLKGKPAMPGQHLRVRNSDFMLFAQQNGLIYALDRRSRVKQGFPVDLKAELTNPFFVQKGSNTSNTQLVCLTDEGVLIKLNLRGEIIGREQLYRESASDKFTLVQSNNKRNYLIARQSNQQTTFIDQGSQELFAIATPSGEVEFQYYTFNGDNAIVIVIDKINGFTYFYDQSGRKLHRQPLNSAHKIAMLHIESRGMYQIYSNYQNQFTVFNLKK